MSIGTNGDIDDDDDDNDDDNNANNENLINVFAERKL